MALRLTVLGAEVESALRLEVIAADNAALSKDLPANDELIAIFGGSDRHTYNAAVSRANGGGVALTVTFPTARYEELLYPFAHNRSVELRGRKLGNLGTLELDGSAWAINATDECRRMKIPPARGR